MVRVALYHAQLGVVLLKNEHVTEDVPINDWLSMCGAGPYLSLENFIATLLPDLELVPVHMSELCLFLWGHHVLVVVFAQLEKHWAVFFVIVVILKMVCSKNCTLDFAAK